jgi:hypothetical protein
MPHGMVGSITRPRPVGRVPVLANDANPAVGCRTDPWEPTPEKTPDAGFSASRTPAQVPRADVTLATPHVTECANRWGFGGQPAAVGPYHVGFTPVSRTRSVLVCERDANRLVTAVNRGILSLIQDS